MSNRRKEKHSGITVPAAASAVEALAALARTPASSGGLVGSGYPERLVGPIPEHGSAPNLTQAARALVLAGETSAEEAVRITRQETRDEG